MDASKAGESDVVVIMINIGANVNSTNEVQSVSMMIILATPCPL